MDYSVLVEPVLCIELIELPRFRQSKSSFGGRLVSDESLAHRAPICPIDSLVTHRVEPVMPHVAARVSGTVIDALEITKDGKVRHAMAVSGPRLS